MTPNNPLIVRLAGAAGSAPDQKAEVLASLRTWLLGPDGTGTKGGVWWTIRVAGFAEPRPSAEQRREGVEATQELARRLMAAARTGAVLLNPQQRQVLERIARDSDPTSYGYALVEAARDVLDADRPRTGQSPSQAIVPTDAPSPQQRLQDIIGVYAKDKALNALDGVAYRLRDGGGWSDNAVPLAECVGVLAGVGFLKLEGPDAEMMASFDLSQAPDHWNAKALGRDLYDAVFHAKFGHEGPLRAMLMQFIRTYGRAIEDASLPPVERPALGGSTGGDEDTFSHQK